MEYIFAEFDYLIRYVKNELTYSKKYLISELYWSLNKNQFQHIAHIINLPKYIFLNLKFLKRPQALLYWSSFRKMEN